MRLQGKKIAYFIGPLFEDLEFYVPYMRLLEEGADVTVVGEDTDTEYPSKHGCLGQKADAAAADVTADQFDAVMIPGGYAPDKMRRVKAMTNMLKEMYDDGKLIGMICHAGQVGISAGIVKGHACTGSTAIKDDIENAGGTWRDEAAFRDGNIVWGRVVADIPEFNRVFIEELVKELG